MLGNCGTAVFRGTPLRRNVAGQRPSVLTAARTSNGSGTEAPAPRHPSFQSSPLPQQNMANLLVRCPDAKGVVASLSQLLYGYNCNIVSSDQFSDESFPPQFYQRIELDYSDALVGTGNLPVVLERGITELARRYSMEWQISYRARRKRVALLVSRLDHCLYDILIRHESGELNCEIPVVVSNWPDLAGVAAKFGIEFRHLPVTAETKECQEGQLEALLAELEIDVVVLARYMQIFSREFADRNWKRVINVHHGFLPAFQGARPYHRAYERGVKLIGATAHFATSELDCGPIIAQDTVQVTHRDSIDDMVRKGRDLERLVLARALRWTLQDRVLVTTDNGRTVVFED
jgi:formyltetrahydrofolate deformylase